MDQSEFHHWLSSAQKSGSKYIVDSDVGDIVM